MSRPACVASRGLVLGALALGAYTWWTEAPPVRGGASSVGSLRVSLDSALLVESLIPAAEAVTLERARERIAAALTVRSQGAIAEAAAALETEGREGPMGDWAMMLAAETVAVAGDEEEVVRLLRRVPRDLARSRGWHAIVTAREAGGRPRDAAAAALLALRRLPTSGDSSRAFAAAGRALLSAGDTIIARRSLTKAVRVAPGSIGAAVAADLLAGLRRQGRWTPTLHRLSLSDLEIAAEHLDARPASGLVENHGLRASAPAARSAASLSPHRAADVKVASAAGGAVGRILALEALGLPEAAELERVRGVRVLATQPGGLRALADAYRAVGRPRDAAWVARAGRGGSTAFERSVRAGA
jgi:hypothetical protein